MNDLEVIFLSYFLNENKWNYLDSLSDVKDFEVLPEIINIKNINKPPNNELKALILYLIYASMATKVFHYI